MEAYLRSLLTSTLDGGRLSASLPDRFISGEKASVPTEQDAGWASETVRTFLGDKNQLLLPGTGGPISPPVTSSLYGLSYSGFCRQNSISECSSCTTQKLLLAVNTTIELKNVIITFHNAVTLLIQNIPCKMQLLWDMAVIFFSSIVALTSKGQFFSWIVPVLHSESDIPFSYIMAAFIYVLKFIVL
jgi:hypothetical protein